MTTTPPGWYDDAHGAMRWWDGAAWTEHVATRDVDESDVQQTAVIAPVAVGAASSADTIPLSSGAWPAEPVSPFADTLPYPGGYIASPDSQPPAGYPGGYPASYPTQGGAFIAATEPRRSRLWVVWVVLGVIVLGFVIGVSVLVPMFFMAVQSGVESSGTPDGTSTEEEPTEAIPANADEQAAIAAVQQYDDAYQTGDCDAYLASTTENFREGYEVTDCDEFADDSSAFAESVDDYVVSPTSVETNDDGTISVYTTETFTSWYDEDGNETDAAQAYEYDYEYDLVSTDDGWVIDAIYGE